MEQINPYRTLTWRHIRFILYAIASICNMVLVGITTMNPKENRTLYDQLLFGHLMGYYVMCRVVVEYERELQTKYISWIMLWRTLFVILPIPMLVYIICTSVSTYQLVCMYFHSPLLLSSIILYTLWILEINSNPPPNYNILPQEPLSEQPPLIEQPPQAEPSANNV